MPSKLLPYLFILCFCVAVSQTKYCYSLEVKIFSTPKCGAGYATDSMCDNFAIDFSLSAVVKKMKTIE